MMIHEMENKNNKNGMSITGVVYSLSKQQGGKRKGNQSIRWEDERLEGRAKTRIGTVVVITFERGGFQEIQTDDWSILRDTSEMSMPR